ncbi:MAG: HD domain-containing protein [Lachnospiraceae bacterium]|nr:HD domain-containing protein [Lachnospiraceae bacterium]
MDKNRFLEFFRKHGNVNACIVCILGVGINLLFDAAVSAMGLPLHLDTIGTVTVAVMGGYLPAVAVGFLTNLIRSFTNQSAMYYGVLNVLIAYVASFLARRGYFKRWQGMYITVPIFTIIGGGLGMLIPWYMESLAFDGEALSAILYQTGFFNSFVSHLLASLIMDLPDKLATVVIVMLILHFIPANFYRYCGFHMWMQKPVSGMDMMTKVRSNVRVLSLRIKMLIVLVISLTVVGLVAMFIGVRIYYKASINEHMRLAQGTASLAAKVIDGDRVNDYLATGGKAEGYEETKRLLVDILQSSPEVSFLYSYKITDKGYRVVFDIDTEDVPANAIGELLPVEESFAAVIPDLLEGKEVEPVYTNDNYGHLLTAMKPVYDSAGKCVCYAIVDVDVEKINTNMRSFLAEMITIFLSFFILLCVFVVWLSDYHIIYPVRSITTQLDGFANTLDSQSLLDEYVKELRSLDIHTGDEVERLFKSICSMTRDQAEQTRSIRQLSSSTARMQDGLIITMANMVENRDSDTGAHVQKTSAYVKIIVEGLKAKGYYAEKITPKFMSAVVRSAPLHDVGKINIPDEVLNKPGKLTDEEYEIMKTHTTAGKKIIEDAIDTVEGENYLKEARNMAAYHHERWDGKGYPEQLHGEVIPLAARIMAVADVFDALTSPRVYKPAFPLEKALAIIEEGKGTQFDPKCVEVFMDSLSEVKVILRKYNQNV